MQILIIKKLYLLVHLTYLRKNFKPREPSLCLVTRHKKGASLRESYELF